MPPVAVVSDTTCYVPSDLVERDGLTLVDLYIVFGGDRNVRESEITDYPAFFEELRSSEQLPTTSQPSVGDFVAAYEPLLEQGRDVVSIHISGGLSGTVESARQAAETLQREGKGGERVRVVDSTTAAGALGILVLCGARAAASGASLEEVALRVTDARSELKMWFAIDTLEFLRRGGRIGAASAWIGSTLKVKPILTIDGEMVPVERVRTNARMIDRLVEYASELHEADADAWVVQHINAPDQAAALTERCREMFGCEPLFTSEVGPVLSAHTGPGMLGVGATSKRFFA